MDTEKNHLNEPPVQLAGKSSQDKNVKSKDELSHGTLVQAVIDNLPPTSGLNSSNESIDSEELRRLNVIMTCSLNYLRRVPCSGIFMAIMASMFSTVSHLTVKLIPNVNSFVIVIFSSFFSLVVFWPITIHNGWSFFGIEGERVALFSRAIFGFFNVSMGFAAFTLIPLADATTIISAAPIFVSIFAPCILGEECGLSQVIVIIMTIAGVFLASQPTFLFPHDHTGDLVAISPNDRLFGSFLSSISCITAAFCFISMRGMQRTPCMVVMNMYQFFTMICCCLTLVVMHFTGLLPNGIGLPSSLYDYGCMVLAAVAVVGVQCFLTVSFKLEEANIVSLVRTSDILFAFLLQIIFLGSGEINSLSIIGAVVVSLGVMSSALRSWLMKRPKKCPALWCLLNCGFNKSREFSA